MKTIRTLRNAEFKTAMSHKNKAKFPFKAFVAGAAFLVLTGCTLPDFETRRNDGAAQSWQVSEKAAPASAPVRTEPAAQSWSNPAQAKPSGFRSKGLNLQDFFAYDIQDPLERSKRAEVAIVQLQKQVDALEAALMAEKAKPKMHMSSHAPHPSSMPKSLQSTQHAKVATPAKPAVAAPKKIIPAAKLTGPLGVIFPL